MSRGIAGESFKNEIEYSLLISNSHPTSHIGNVGIRTSNTYLAISVALAIG